MKDGFRIFDCNRHVIEPAGLWDAHLEEPARSRAAVGLGESGAGVSVMGRAVSQPRLDFLGADAYRACFASAIDAGFSGEANLADMDREGTDAALLFPTAGMYATWADHLDSETSAAICRAYNRWLRDFCATDPARLKGVALLPLQSIDSAIAELGRTVEEDGHVAFLMRSNPLLKRYLHDPLYDRLYAAAESLGVPVIVKESMGSVLPEIGAERYSTSLYEAKGVIDPFEVMLAFLSFFGANVAERFPNLRVGFAGAGAGWLPFWLERHEEHWGGVPFGNDCPSTLPADWLFPKQGFVVADPWETTVPEVVELVADSCVTWGSYYPLPEAITTFPNGAEKLVDDDRLARESKERVLWDNATRLFRAS